jgi:hypothetical protein
MGRRQRERESEREGREIHLRAVKNFWGNHALSSQLIHRKQLQNNIKHSKKDKLIEK